MSQKITHILYDYCHAGVDIQEGLGQSLMFFNSLFVHSSAVMMYQRYSENAFVLLKSTI